MRRHNLSNGFRQKREERFLALLDPKIGAVGRGVDLTGMRVSA